MRITVAVVLLAAFLATFFVAEAVAAEKKPKAVASIGNEPRGGWLGVSIQDITPKIAKKKELKTDEGAYVNDVVDDSPADSAGIKEGDVIVEFNGKKIDDTNDLMRAVQKTKPGTKATIVLLRSNEKKSMDVSVGKMPKRNVVGSMPMQPPRAPRIAIFGRTDMWGLHLSELNEQLGEYFGAPNGHGLLVEKVEKKGSGEKAGFKAGDVITKINKKSIEEMRDLRDAVEDAEEGDKVEVEVLRKGSSKTLSVEITESDTEPSSFNFHFDPFPGPEMMREFEMENLQMQLRRSLPDMRNLQIEIEKIRDGIRRVTV